MSQRYQSLFTRLKQQKQGALVPFVVVGDPNLEQSYQIITSLIEGGADALELGLPFSDPIADGPVIQAAAQRALQQGATINRCFELVAAIRRDYPDLPIGLLVYANLVVANGVSLFYQQAAKAGVDSILLADVPMLESGEFCQAAQNSAIAPIFIATPNADQSLLKQIAAKSQGYTYLLSRKGVTGTETQADMAVETILDSLRQFKAPPALLGFGIATPKQVKDAINAGVDGVICGSAIVEIIAQYLEKPEQMRLKLIEFVKGMKQATRLET